jgi:hypothetical protein
MENRRNRLRRPRVSYELIHLALLYWRFFVPNNQFEIVLRQRLFNFWDEMKIYFVERLVLVSEDDSDDDD